MRVYCSACGTAHYFRNSQAERLLYALQARQYGFGGCLGALLRQSEGERPLGLRGVIDLRVAQRKAARVTLP